MSDDPTRPFGEASAAFVSAPAYRQLDAHQHVDEATALARIMFSNQSVSHIEVGRASDIIKHFGSLAGVLNASAIDLDKQGIDIATFYMLQAVNASILHVLQAEIKKGPLISSWDAVTEYLTATMAHHKQERFKILYLDRKNRLIADENQSIGTVDHVPVYPREVAKRALELDASAIILAHNHPSGDPRPSSEDINMTAQIVEACEAIGVRVHDHAIVGHNGEVLSMRTEGLCP